MAASKSKQNHLTSHNENKEFFLSIVESSHDEKAIVTLFSAEIKTVDSPVQLQLLFIEEIVEKSLHFHKMKTAETASRNSGKSVSQLFSFSMESYPNIHLPVTDPSLARFRRIGIRFRKENTNQKKISGGFDEV